MRHAMDGANLPRTGGAGRPEPTQARRPADRMARHDNGAQSAPRGPSRTRHPGRARALCVLLAGGAAALESAVADYFAAPGRSGVARIDDLLAALRGAVELEAIPAAGRQRAGTATVLALLDVFGRIDPPAPSALPSGDSFDEAEIAAVRLSGTPLRLRRLEASPRAGEWLFDGMTVTAAPRFLSGIEAAPLRSDLAIDSWTRALPQVTGPLFPPRLSARLPVGLQALRGGLPIWKVAVLAVAAVAAGGDRPARPRAVRLVRRMPHAHPRIDDDTIRVRYLGPSAAGRDIDLRFYARTREWNEFFAIREDTFLRLDAILETAGARIAVPAQVLHVGRDAAADPELRDEAEAQVAAWREAGTLPFPKFPADELAGLDNTLGYPPKGSPDAGSAEPYRIATPETLSQEPAPIGADPPQRERAGNAMNRRAFYQYGVLLPVDPYGYVTQGQGQSTSRGAVTLIPPTRIVSEPFEAFAVDGVPMVFQNTPDTEAPSKMNTWIPSMEALWMAENVTHGLHNIYTLRGAPVRDALNWSKHIAEALYRFGAEAEIMLAAHHWWRWGNARIRELLRAQRDIYANMHNHVLHHANNGVTINHLHNVYSVPEALQAHWHVRGYHGSPEHNARGVIQRYLGYWDCNPATLVPPSPEESAPVYVRMMGGAGAIIAEAAKLCESGDYRMAVEILNKLALAEPDNQEGGDLLADALEQIGYQQENPGLRNSFLAGAFELRSGIPSGAIPKTTGADVMRAMSTKLFLNFLGILLDSAKAAGHRFTMNLRTPDTGEAFIVELENATLTSIKGYQAPDADLTLTIDRAALDETLVGAKSLEAHLAEGTATVEGDASILRTLAGLLVDFVPNFEVFPGTRQDEPSPAGHDPFDAQEMKQVVPE